MRTSFRATWTAAVLAATSAFILELGVRAETLRLGYALADAAAERAALMETQQQLTLRAQLARTHLATRIVSPQAKTPAAASTR